MAKKIQSPVFEQVIEAYEVALNSDESIPQDVSKRLIDLLKDDAAPNGKKVTESLFPPSVSEAEA